MARSMQTPRSRAREREQSSPATRTEDRDTASTVTADGNEVMTTNNADNTNAESCHRNATATATAGELRRTRFVVRQEVESLSPPGSQPIRRQNNNNNDDEVVLVEMTRGWARNMPNEVDSDEAASPAEAIDLTTASQAEDEIQVLSSNVRRSVPVVRKRRRDNTVEATTSALVLRMLQQQQQAAEQLAAQPPEPPPTNPTCGICFEAMGKNTDRPMAAGNCGYVVLKLLREEKELDVLLLTSSRSPPALPALLTLRASGIADTYTVNRACCTQPSNGDSAQCAARR